MKAGGTIYNNRRACIVFVKAVPYCDSVQQCVRSIYKYIITVVVQDGLALETWMSLDIMLFFLYFSSLCKLFYI